jgi:hypothetical protein
LQAWRDMVGRIPGVEGRDDVLRKLRELQRWDTSTPSSVLELGDHHQHWHQN